MLLHWCLLVLLIPILGALLYLVFGESRIRNKALRKWMLAENYKLDPEIDIVGHQRVQGLIRDVERINQYWSTTAERVDIIADPVAAYQVLLEAIRSAKRTIMVEYYMIRNDRVGNRVLEELTKKAQQGVKVFLLFDYLGSWTINKYRIANLKAAGGVAASFAPFQLIFRMVSPNLRNHRKLVIVDSSLAITGSANVGNNYFGRRYSKQNRDYLVIVEGKIVEHLEQVFYHDWRFSTDHPLPKRELSLVKISGTNSVPLQVIDSGPHTLFENLHESVLHLLSVAQHNIRIASPYLAPSEPVLYALRLAVRRGVRVEIMIPRKSDSAFLDIVGRSFARELADVGASIYIYEENFLHSKMIIVDDRYILLGSANMDCRSFRLNFELSLIVDSERVAKRANEIFNHDYKFCGVLDDPSQGWRMLENLSRIFSPQL